MTEDAEGPPPRLAVALDVDATGAELAADELFSLGATAVSELPGVDAVTLVADLDADALAVLQRAGRRPRVLEPQTAWTEGWRDHARAWRCGERLVVRPAWVEPEPLGEGDVEVVVDPGAAFGSGSHATTRLCLAALDGLVRPGARVLDVGCGSGVLGVAAALLGAEEVVAIDVEDDAVRATRAVAELNGVGSAVTASTTPLVEVHGSFDLVLANLLIPIIEELGGDLVGRVAPDGSLVLSGVLTGQVERATAAVAGLVHRDVSAQDGWAAVVLTRPGGS